MLFSLIKTKGHSMEPKIKNGSFFIASNIPYKFTKPKVNDLVVFEYQNIFLVKKIVKINSNKYFIEGENKKDSLKINDIIRDQIKAKVIWIF
jgi:signal peptidase I